MSARKWTGGSDPKYQGAKAKKYNVNFNDHTGKPALMSWWGSDKRHNPPNLPSWIFYMVNPETPRDFDGCEFALGLEDSRYFYDNGGFRYEFFFLPGATAEECVAHYRGELAARGTIWHQVRKVTQALKEKHAASEGAVDDPAEALPPGDDDEPYFGVTSEQGLPGFPWVKEAQDWYFTTYRNWLLMYLDADIPQWDFDEDHNVCVVEFDPMPIEWEEGERVKWDPVEHPTHLRQKKVRSMVDNEEALTAWMSDRTHSRWAYEACEATTNAEELGWEAW